MNRPNNQPEDLDRRRKAARKTAITVAVLAVLVYIGFMVLVLNRHG
ncbi:hypothetical protein [Aquilutibacter rugosus]